MSHWLAWKLGQITKAQAYQLQGLKLSNRPKYEHLEHKWGADRKSLEAHFGKERLKVLEARIKAQEAEERRYPRKISLTDPDGSEHAVIFRTARSKQKYPIRKR